MSAWLTFNRKDMAGIVVLLMMLVLVIFSPRFFSKKSGAESPGLDTAWAREFKKPDSPNSSNRNQRPAERGDVHSFVYRNNQAEKPSVIHPFYFDPNTIDAEGWSRLGLKTRTIATIINFLSKGGKFRKPEDLSKIYGLRKEEYDLLAPYIRIAENEGQRTPFIREQRTNQDDGRRQPIDINLADSTDFIALPGIGNKLASRIISFRTKLGGFYSINQVGETFGLADSVFKKIKPLLVVEPSEIKKININTATIDELKAHPYIRYAIAAAIVAFRQEHGVFSQIEDIKKIRLITEEVYSKLSPYLLK